MKGLGKLFYQNGKLAYTGHFKSNVFHGKGKILNKNPTQLNSPFNYNNFNSVENHWTSYDGYFSLDKKVGYGTLHLQNGEKFIGYFKNDMVNGRGTFYSKN